MCHLYQREFLGLNKLLSEGVRMITKKILIFSLSICLSASSLFCMTSGKGNPVESLPAEIEWNRKEFFDEKKALGLFFLSHQDDKMKFGKMTDLEEMWQLLVQRRLNSDTVMLFFAVVRNEEALFRGLLEKAFGKDKLLPVFLFALEAKKFSFAKLLLLKFSHDIGAFDIGDYTNTWHCLFENSRITSDEQSIILQLLIDNGFDINHEIWHGGAAIHPKIITAKMTPLMSCIANGELSLFATLLGMGACINDSFEMRVEVARKSQSCIDDLLGSSESVQNNHYYDPLVQSTEDQRGAFFVPGGCETCMQMGLDREAVFNGLKDRRDNLRTAPGSIRYAHRKETREEDLKYLNSVPYRTAEYKDQEHQDEAYYSKEDKPVSIFLSTLDMANLAYKFFEAASNQTLSKRVVKIAKTKRDNSVKILRYLASKGIISRRATCHKLDDPVLCSFGKCFCKECIAKIGLQKKDLKAATINGYEVLLNTAIERGNSEGEKTWRKKLEDEAIDQTAKKVTSLRCCVLEQAARSGNEEKMELFLRFFTKQKRELLREILEQLKKETRDDQRDSLKRALMSAMENS